MIADTPLDEDIIDELYQQKDEWGEQNHNPEKWLVILMEEVGEAAQAVLKMNRNNYRREMIQVIAVGISAVECLDRHWKPVR